MLRPLHRVRSLTFGALCAGLLLACSAGPPTGGGGPASGDVAEPSIPASPVSPPAGRIVYPLDAFGADDQQRATLERARELLIRDCMSAKGFAYEMRESPHRPPPRTGTYGVVDPAHAAVYGYHAAQPEPGSNQRLDTRPPDDYLLALQGFVHPPTDGSATPPGCAGEAADQIYDYDGTAHVDLGLLGRLAEQAVGRTAQDSRVLAATQVWSTCMAEQGFRFATPAEAATAAWPERPDAREIATAVADVACKERANFLGIWVAVESGYQQEYIDRNAGALAEIRKILEAQVGRAAAVLAGGR